jgi:putative addiction module killer protein
MYIVSETPEFNQWLRSIKDKTTRIRLLRRLDKVHAGNLGDIKPVGDSVYEMREHFGPGWRMYYVHARGFAAVDAGWRRQSRASSRYGTCHCIV